MLRAWIVVGHGDAFGFSGVFFSGSAKNLA
jgi:hypothetical protein